MRPQLNLALDEYPELPARIKEYCKAKRIRIADFAGKVLSEAIEENAPVIPPSIEERFTQIESELYKLKNSYTTDKWLIKELSKLLDPRSYPVNNASKIKARIREIIEKLESEKK